MNKAVPDCLVHGFEHLVDGLDLPDPDDRHVLAAAIRAGAQAIITTNMTDFPASKLKAYAVEAIHPDDFVLDLLDLAPGAIASVVVEQAATLRSPPRTVQDLLGTLREQGLVRSVAKLHEVLGAVAG